MTSSSFEAARALEPSGAELEAMMEALSQVARDFFAEREGRPAYLAPPSSPVTASPFGDAPAPMADAVRDVVSMLRYGVGTSSARFFGYVPGGGLPTAAAGDFLAALLNPYAGVYGASPGAVAIENRCVAFFCSLFGLPEGSWGTLTSGGSLATITALAVARDTLDASLGSDEDAFDVRRVVVYGTSQTHHCETKALRLIGMGKCQRRTIEVDDTFRMRPEALVGQIHADRAQGLKPWLLFASAGTTNTGSVDPLDALATIAHEEGLWFHVDGAYGGLFQLTTSGANSLAGIHRADSLVVDPHKAFFLPYGTGVCLIRDGAKLHQSFSEDAAYLADCDDDNVRAPSGHSAELTRHFRGLRLWLSLKTHGLARFREALTEKLVLANRLAERLEGIGLLELACRPELSVVVFRHKDGDGATRRLLESLLARGRVHVSSTLLDGTLWIRACVLSFRSHEEHIDELVSEVTSVLAL